MTVNPMGDVWLITGSGRGLGRAIAEAVVAAGHRLAATARRPELLADLVAKNPGNVRAIPLDVCDPAAARQAVEDTIHHFGAIDVVVNNAGYGSIAPIEDMTEDVFRAQVETNFFGTVNVTRAALPHFRRRRRGHFIQISSIGGRRATVGLSAYQSAKFAVEGFSEALAKETAPLGIKVTIVEPGGMRTEWSGASMTVGYIRDEYRSTVGEVVDFLHGYSGSEPGDPTRIARAILHVATLEKPPLRLLLGTDAVYLAEATAADRAAEDNRWRELSMSTDLDRAPAPLAD
jgi:NAD(P)-dependent dehydrogenase (short-subunit alcohol dehydrogenase family)